MWKMQSRKEPIRLFKSDFISFSRDSSCSAYGKKPVGYAAGCEYPAGAAVLLFLCDRRRKAYWPGQGAKSDPAKGSQEK